MGTTSARWWSGLLLAGLVLPGCCSTCGKNSWGWPTSSSTPSTTKMPPAYPTAPYQQYQQPGSTMPSYPPPTGQQQMQPMPATGGHSGYGQPRSPGSSAPSNFTQFPAPSSPVGMESGQAGYYNRPIGGNRATNGPQPGGSPLMDSPMPPSGTAGMMPPNRGGSAAMEPPPPSAPTMPVSNTTTNTEPPIVPPGPPTPPSP